jgi:predicted MFS family arabinose efflux permease
VLTALPVGFALGAVVAVVPRTWTDRRRATLGAVVSVAALVALALVPRSTGSLVPLLAVLGWGLGTFTPANNGLVMRQVPARAAGTGGSLLTTARSLGTALGVAVVTLVLHLRPEVGGMLDGPSVALLVLAVAALGTLAGTRAAA